MKTKLLALFALAGFTAQAQQPITSFTPDPASAFALFTIDAPLNQSPQGANVSWSFSGFTEIGSAHYYTSAPLPSELLDYPGSTGRLRHEEIIGPEIIVTDIFFKSPGNNVSITGASGDGIQLNYNTNNANIGTYPLEYGYNNTDAVAGNYVYDTYSGTFAGNITTSVDAYGTLNLVGDGLPASTPVTRMKTTQTLSMNYGIFTNVGTFTQTIWDYYGSGIDPILRVTTTSTSIPLLSINETSTIAEVYLATLKTQSWQAGSVRIAPNPVNDVLRISADGPVQSVTLTDMTGKTVLVSTDENTDVSALQKGVYLARIATEKGISTQKIVKQ